MQDLMNNLDEASIQELWPLVQNVDIQPKRNDFCYCMSGEKYKNCCALKEKELKVQSVELKELHLVSDSSPEVFQYNMTDEDYLVAADCYDLFLTGEFDENSQALELFDALLKKYPEHPILNFMNALRYFLLEEEKSFQKVIQSNLKQFPGAKSNYLLFK